MKLVVADDEKWVRAAITNLIPFKELGLDLAGEASNGMEALEICRQVEPDILVTDIMMPGINGLDLIQQVKDILPDTGIIIISGYGEFEYSKRAIKLGVTDYILKPVNQSELKQALVKIKREILDKKKHIEEQKLMANQYRKALPYVHEKLMNRLITENTLTVSSIKASLSSLNIDFPHNFFTIVSVRPHNPSVLSQWQTADRYKALVRSTMRRYLKGITFTSEAKSFEMTAIINHSCQDISPQVEKALGICAAIYGRKYHDTLNSGISSTSQLIKSLPELYKQASEALSLSFWNEGCSIFYYGQGQLSNVSSMEVPEQAVEDMAYNIRLSDLKSVFSRIDDIQKFFLSRPPVPPVVVREFIWALVQSVTSRLNIHMSFISYETSVSGEHPYERIRKLGTLDQLCSYTKDVLQHVCDHYHGKNPVSSKSIIDTAKNIIEQNFNKDISLEKVAHCVHLNSTYLSELFKKETGMSFIDYKTYLRIENAKKLLLSTDLSASEISSRVGYTDPKYFCKLFKRVTGMTIHGYKKDDVSRAETASYT